MRVNEATVADAVAVIGLWEEAGLTRPWNDAAGDFRKALAGATSAVLVIREEAAVIGSIMAGDDGHRGWVYYLAVAATHRRRGLGRELMAGAEAWLRGRGVAKVQLLVREGNDDALAFYAALGLERQAVVTLGRFL